MDTKNKQNRDRALAKTKNIQNACLIVGIPFDEECESSVNKRNLLYKKAKKIDPSFAPVKSFQASPESTLAVKETPSGALAVQEIEVPALETKKLLFEKIHNKFIIEGEKSINVIVTMSEGYTYEEAGTQKQIPELVVTLKRSSDLGDATVRQVSQMMMAGVRPVTKSSSSIKYNGITRETIRPSSFDEAIQIVTENYESRVKDKFGFSIDFSALKESRFGELFERALSGTRLLTTVCECK